MSFWKILGTGVLCALTVAVLHSHALASSTDDAPNLTGIWACSDGGTYTLKQKGNTLHWVGRSADGGATWTHRFEGTIDKDLVSGSWRDSPSALIHGKGNLVIRIVARNRLEYVSSSSPFGGRTWTLK
jgi:hypothetical protein